VEAALIPFVHNTFSFADGALLPQFVSSLVPAQASAITSLALSNIFAADVIEREYWYGFPELRRLAITVRGHAGCSNRDQYFRDYRQFNEFYISDARKTWRDIPSYEPLEHFNLEAFELRIVCACGLVMQNCLKRQDWQHRAEAVGQRVSTRGVRKRPERRPDSGRHLLQIHPLNRAVSIQPSLANHLWKCKGLCVQYLVNLKRSLTNRLPPLTRSGS
jgi:hypothetical protein